MKELIQWMEIQLDNLTGYDSYDKGRIAQLQECIEKAREIQALSGAQIVAELKEWNANLPQTIENLKKDFLA